MLRVGSDAVDEVAGLQLAAADAEHGREQGESGTIDNLYIT